MSAVVVARHALCNELAMIHDTKKKNATIAIANDVRIVSNICHFSILNVFSFLFLLE